MKKASLNVNKIRKEFPIFRKNPSLIYFDNASTSLKPSLVIKAINHYNEEVSSNAHRAVYKTAEFINQKYWQTKDQIKTLINASSKDEIIFTSNASHSLNQTALGIKAFLKKGDEIITTTIEHSSSILPIFKYAKEVGCKIKYIEQSNQPIIWKDIQPLITEKTKWISLVHVSNVLGYINQVEEIGKKLADQKNKIYYSVDATQSLLHCSIDVKKINCDFLSFSAHKIFGPTGIGVLYMKKSLQPEIDSIFLGGGNNHLIKRDGTFTYKNGAQKFEVGTLNLSGIYGLSEAILYLNQVNKYDIHAYLNNLKDYFLMKITKLKEVKIYNSNPDIPIFLIAVANHFAEDVATQLSLNNICVRSGQHCVKLFKPLKNDIATIRISLSIYNTKDEIDIFINSLSNLGDCLDAFF